MFLKHETQSAYNIILRKTAIRMENEKFVEIINRRSPAADPTRREWV